MTPRLPRAALVRTPRSARRRPVITAATALAGTLLLSGCQLTSPIQTNKPFDPADGVSVSLGDVQIRDLLVVSEARGEPGVISGYVLNKGSEPVTVSIGIKDGSAATAEVKAGEQTLFSAESGESDLTLASIDAAPGDTLPLTVSTPSAGANEVQVPVLLPEGYYEKLTPAAPSESTPTPSTPTPSTPTPSTPTPTATSTP